MFKKVLEFFIENSKMNYTLFLLVFLAGIYSYIHTPKEIFPSVDLEKITLSGNYSGASIDVLDKMAVTEIEDELKNLDGIDTMTTTIAPGKFQMLLDLNEGENKYNLADKVKDAVDSAKKNFPSDMDDPRVGIIEVRTNVLQVDLSSNKFEKHELIEYAKELKQKLSNIENISEIEIRGEADQYIKIQVDERKVEAYGLKPSTVYDAIKNLSYIFPIGKIEDQNEHLFISTYNGKKEAPAIENTLLKIDGKKLYLRDIARVQKEYKSAATLSSLENKNSVSLVVSKNEEGDTIVISRKIKDLVAKTSFKDIELTVHMDRSQFVKERLDIVISNIFVGIVLVTLSMTFLINARISLIVAIGIPTSFVIGMVYFYMFGYTINLISLLGVLIAIGIVVDDAIVVSENIQHYVEQGMSAKEAALRGASEMAKPVFIASLTTLFAFLPLLMISGTMGKFIMMIPIAVSALVVASLLESFIFLPIHAAHTLSPKAKTLSWERVNLMYEKVLLKILEFKRTFLLLFFIIVPVLTVYGIKESRFQMFPRFDSMEVHITAKANISTKVEESFELVKQIEKDLLALKKELHIKTISTTAGFFKDSEGRGQIAAYGMYITIELLKNEPSNLVDTYVTPLISYGYEGADRTRTLTSIEISKRLRELIKPYKEQFNLESINVVERRAGPVKTDIKIGLSHYDNQTTIDALRMLKEKLTTIKGVTSVNDNASLGASEIKLRINSYGEQLGIDEALVATQLNKLFLSQKLTTSFDEKNILDVVVESVNKDALSTLLNYRLEVAGQKVELRDVVYFETVESFEKITKEEGEKTFFIFANVNPKIVTASEVLAQIEPLLEGFKQDGFKLMLKGEKEKNERFKSDMLAALVLAMLLILLALLYLFNSFKDTFILLTVIPFSFLGVLIGHYFMGMNLTMPSVIGALGLAGVVINDGIIMLTYVRRTKALKEVLVQAQKRFRPIILTSLTTLIGLSTLIFFATGQAVIMQPMAVSIGFGLAWGTVLNLLYLPSLYVLLHKIK